MCNVELKRRGKGKTCARQAGHSGQHESATSLVNRRATIRELRRQYRAARTPEQHEADKASAREYNKTYHPRADIKQRRREHHLTNAYGITLEDYDALLATQGGVCVICHNGTDEPLHVDHDHTTGKVRGLLCSNCNTGIGLLKDDPVRLRAAADYLEEKS